MLSQLVGRGIKHVLHDCTGRDSWKLVPGFCQTLPHVPFLFADLVLYHFTPINLSCEYNYMLSVVSPHSESLKPVGASRAPYSEMYCNALAVQL